MNYYNLLEEYYGKYDTLISKIVKGEIDFDFEDFGITYHSIFKTKFLKDYDNTLKNISYENNSITLTFNNGDNVYIHDFQKIYNIFTNISIAFEKMFNHCKLNSLENKFNITPTTKKKKIAIIGIGGAGYYICSCIKKIFFTKKHIEFLILEDKNIGETTLKRIHDSNLPLILNDENFKENIENKLKDKDIVFLISGLGGDTGTNLCLKVSKIAKKENIPNIAIVTKPFNFEGERRNLTAQTCIQNLNKYNDFTVVLPLQNTLNIKTEENKGLGFSKILETIPSLLIKDFSHIISKIEDNTNLTIYDFKNIMYFFDQTN